MKTKRPWMPLYVSDFINSEEVIAMPDDACGIYIKLLCHNWDKGDLPANPDMLAKIVRRNPRSFRRLWPIIQHLFPEYSPGRLTNHRVMNELKRADDRSEKSSNAVKVRESKRSNDDASQHSTTHNSTADHKEHTPAATPLGLVSSEPTKRFNLEAVYDEYPRKIGKTPGLAKLAKQIKTDADYEIVMRGVVAFAVAMESERRPSEKIPHFSTWVHQEQWRDYAAIDVSATRSYSNFSGPRSPVSETKEDELFK